MDNMQLMQMDNTLAVMRLMVEGAVSILEDETTPLLRLALDQKMHQEALAFCLIRYGLVRTSDAHPGSASRM